MKNIFSKTLICGVIASSFILVNCQKAPSSRGVKGTAGKAALPADTKAAEAAKVIVKCSPEFLKEYSAWSILMKSDEAKNLNKIKSKDEVNEEQILALKAFRKELESKIANVEPEVKKMRDEQDKIAAEKKQESKKIDGCVVANDKNRTEYLFDDIQSTTNSYIAKIRIFDGVESERTKLHDKQVEIKNADSDVTKNAKFYVSAELNAALDSAAMEEIYFKNGKALTGTQEKEKAIAAAAVSVCYIDSSSGKLADLDVTLNAMDTKQVGQIGTKVRYVVTMLSGDKDYVISCDLPAKKSISAGFREAMGALLLSKEQREKAKPKESAKLNEDQAAAEKKKAEKAERAAEAKDKETAAAVKAAAERVLSKTVVDTSKVSKEKEHAAIIKAEQEQADKEHQQSEEENIKAMQAAAAT